MPGAVMVVELVTGDRIFDLIEEGIDLAIRMGRLANSSYHAVRIGDFAKWLVASPALFRSNEAPDLPDDVASFPFIALSILPQPSVWTFEGPGKSKQSIRFNPVLSANTALAVRRAAIAGGGLAVLPDFAVAEDVAAGRLIRVLPRWTLPGGDIHAVFPGARHRAKKIRLFIDVLKEHWTGAIARTGGD